MCIIIANKKGILSKQTLKECWNNNRDGGGLAYVENGIIKTYHSLKSFNGLYNKYTHIKKQFGDNKKVLLHFRITSAGETNKINLHPFNVNENLVFAHNGTIYQFTKDKKLSDTILFNEYMLKQLPKDFYKNSAIKDLIEVYIEHSKLVFLDNMDKFYIFNDSYGIEDGGNWYSNSSYKPYISALNQTKGRYKLSKWKEEQEEEQHPSEYCSFNCDDCGFIDCEYHADYKEEESKWNIY